MKCEEVQEYVSALCDGEQIPPSAAVHIGACESCRERMNEYLTMGVELRRIASAEAVEDMPSGTWKQAQRKNSTWWGKGWETMRIPRFAFALLVLTIVALGSGLVMSKVPAQVQGNVLMLTYKLPDGRINRCALSLVDEKNNLCAMLDPTRFLLGLKTLSHNGDQIELGVRAGYIPTVPQAGTFTSSLDDLKKIEEKHYWFRPGDNLEVDVPGWGTMTLAGELMDHMPPFVTLDPAVQMDPKAGKLQVISPLLLRDNKVWFDFANSACVQAGVQMYVPGKGLWTISTLPSEGAVEAKVNLNRVSFELEGHSYIFLMGATVARSEQRVWVLHDPHYQVPGTSAFIGGVDVARYIRENVNSLTDSKEGQIHELGSEK